MMGLVDKLLDLGGKLGVVRIVSTTAAAKPGKVPTRNITLRELETEIRPQEVRALAETPAELSLDFAQVFDSAGLKPPAHGWTIDRLRQTLQAGPYATMDRPAVQQAIVELLSADKAHVHELVGDAIARDKALDAFEEFARGKLDRQAAARARQIAQLEAQLELLGRQLAGLREQAQAESARWRQWHDRKIACEKELAWTCGFLIDEDVISVDREH